MSKIEGRRPVIEALKAGHSLDSIWFAKSVNRQSVGEIVNLAKEQGIPIKMVDKKKIDQMSQSNNHQGVMAFAAAHSYVDLEDIIHEVRMYKNAIIVICDEINDPHNLGSILRSANGAGAKAVIIPKRRNVGLTPIVAKTSAGAIEYTPVCRVNNISNTIKQLKDAGFWIMGADDKADVLYYEADLSGKLAIVIGNEGQGIGRLVKENCDFLVNIPMNGQVSSLNASVAAGILLYEVAKAHSK